MVNFDHFCQERLININQIFLWESFNLTATCHDRMIDDGQPQGERMTGTRQFRDGKHNAHRSVLLSLTERGRLMAFESIMAEVDQLNMAGDRIEGLAEHHAPVSEALISIAGNVRTTATVLAVLVETKLRNGAGLGFPRSKKPI
jgi:hypothetical protein